MKRLTNSFGNLGKLHHAISSLFKTSCKLSYKSPKKIQRKQQWMLICYFWSMIPVHWTRWYFMSYKITIQIKINDRDRRPKRKSFFFSDIGKLNPIRNDVYTWKIIIMYQPPCAFLVFSWLLPGASTRTPPTNWSKIFFRS